MECSGFYSYAHVECSHARSACGAPNFSGRTVAEHRITTRMQFTVAETGWCGCMRTSNPGGDPANVMIFGESGGGAKTSCVYPMPAAEPFFSMIGIGVERHRARKATQVRAAHALEIPCAGRFRCYLGRGSRDSEGSARFQLIDDHNHQCGYVEKRPAARHSLAIPASPDVPSQAPQAGHRFTFG
jgi:hypothetical protein